MKTVAQVFQIVLVTLFVASLLPGKVHAQPELEIRRVGNYWPDIEVYYSLRCSGTLDLTHTDNNLSLWEDVVPITSFTRTCPDTTLVGDISFLLVLDASNSTSWGGFNDMIKAGALALIEKMHPTDEGAVLTYNHFATLAQGMTPDSVLLKQAVHPLTPGGGSATYDAIIAALNHAATAATRSRRAIIAVADGDDNSSMSTPDAVIALANSLRIPVIMIGMGAHFPAHVFSTITDQTGGKLYQSLDSVQTVQAFRDAYEFIADDFERCLLVYRAICGDGGMHTVRLAAQGICGGGDEDSKQYRANVDAAYLARLEFGFPPLVEALTEKSFTMQVNSTVATLGALHGFEMFLDFAQDCIQLDSVSIPPQSPLAGSTLFVVPSSNGARIVSNQPRPVFSPGPFLSLHFTALERMDSTSCTVAMSKMEYSRGCFYTTGQPLSQVNIAVSPKPTITPAGLIELCPGDSVLLTATGGYDSYRWSSQQTDSIIVVKTGGSYSVFVMDHAGRTAQSAPVEVRFRESPRPRLSEGPELILCKGASARVGVSGSYTAYQWSHGPTTMLVTITQPGQYWALVTDSAGCTWISDTLTVIVSDPQVQLSAGGALEFCDGDEVTLDAGFGFAAYQWSNNEQGQRITVRSSGNYSVRVTDLHGCTADSDTLQVTVHALPTAAIAPSGVIELCPGDALTLDGGGQHQGWQWSTGARTRFLQVTGEGVYALRVEDAVGCVSDPDTVLVVTPDRPDLKLPDTVYLCPGGRIDIDGGAAYASWLWSTGATTRNISISSEGRYHLQVVTSGGCVLYSDTVLVEMRDSFVPEIAVSASTTICDGESVELDGGAYASWQWSTGETTRHITVSAAGKYRVTVTDAFGCSGVSEDVEITVLAIPDPVITARTPTRVCEGDSVRLEAPAGYVAYEWSNGESGRILHTPTAGVYSVGVTDADGCVGVSNAIEVIVVALPPRPLITNVGGELHSSEARAYQWYRDGAAMPGVTGRVFIPAVSGRYVVRVFNEDGCWRDSDPVQVTSVPPAAQHPSIPEVYPDPTQGRVTVRGTVRTSGGIEITVSNILGQVVYQFADRHIRGAYTRELDLGAFPRGVYLFHLRFGDVVIVRRVVRQ
jgi:hypothetical protein